jgi:hypothetical protein
VSAPLVPITVSGASVPPAEHDRLTMSSSVWTVSQLEMRPRSLSRLMKTVSLPGPQSTVSGAEPPAIVSSPGPPSMVSVPRPPTIVSMPSPPKIRSSPKPASSRWSSRCHRSDTRRRSISHRSTAGT